MHETALHYGKLFFDVYRLPDNATVLDVGALNVNGSLRTAAPTGALYVGVDLSPGEGVDIVVADGGNLPCPDGHFDAVVSSSCLEHDPEFWITFQEIARVTRSGGYIYLNAPSNGLAYHRYPIDAWRFYPDAALGLCAWAKRQGVAVSLLESFIGERDPTGWHDCVMVFSRGDAVAGPRMVDQLPGVMNVRRSSQTDDLQNYVPVMEPLASTTPETIAEGVLHHPLAGYDRNTTYHLLQNYFPALSLDGERLILDATPATARDEPIAERLMNIYHRMDDYERNAIPPEQRPNEGVWEMMKNEFHGEMYRLLYDRNVPGLADYLRNGLRRRVAIGLGPGPLLYRAICDDPEARIAHVALIKDRLVSLGVALGILSAENPEQGQYGFNITRSSDELIRHIQAAISTEITRPPVMGQLGIDFGGQVVDIRAPEDAYAAFRLKAIMSGSTGKSIAEVGAGFGGLTMQLVRSGFRRCFTFDLPLVTLIQGYFLMQVLGPDAVTMFGEDIDERPVSIQPYWEFSSRHHRFDAVVNRDSMPEMPTFAAIGYLHEIDRRRVPFLSINQEIEGPSGQPGIMQLHVGKLVTAHTSLVRVSRAPYWLRKGYVEELYQPR